jgi:hypothetical protein
VPSLVFSMAGAEPRQRHHHYPPLPPGWDRWLILLPRADVLEAAKSLRERCGGTPVVPWELLPSPPRLASAAWDAGSRLATVPRRWWWWSRLTCLGGATLASESSNGVEPPSSAP